MVELTWGEWSTRMYFLSVFSCLLFIVPFLTLYLSHVWNFNVYSLLYSFCMRSMWLPSFPSLRLLRLGWFARWPKRISKEMYVNFSCAQLHCTQLGKMVRKANLLVRYISPFIQSGCFSSTKRFRKFSWFQRKISESNRTSEKVVLFLPDGMFQTDSFSISSNPSAQCLIPVSCFRGHFSVNETVCSCKWKAHWSFRGYACQSDRASNLSHSALRLNTDSVSCEAWSMPALFFFCERLEPKRKFLPRSRF